MAIFRIASHGYEHVPTGQQMADQLAMFTAAFTSAAHIEEFFVGRYAGDPSDGYHDTACVEFPDLSAYRIHMESPHGPDEVAHLTRARGPGQGVRRLDC